MRDMSNFDAFPLKQKRYPEQPEEEEKCEICQGTPRYDHRLWCPRRHK